MWFYETPAGFWNPLTVSFLAGGMPAGMPRVQPRDVNLFFAYGRCHTVLP